jgi:hypothetical protein
VLATIFAVLLGLILLLIYIVRVMLTILLIAAAPLALACHALPQTEGLAKLWWRAFAGVLAIQVAQALVFVTAIRVLLTTDMVSWFGLRTPGDHLDLWIALCLLYVLVRIPSWISRMVWRGGLHRSPLTRIARSVTALVIFRGVLSRGRAAAAGQSMGRATPPSQLPPASPSGQKALPPSPAPPETSPARQGQPQWARPSQRHVPPDPEWHQRVHADRPAPDSVGEQQRWGNPATVWAAPHAGDWRAPPPRPRGPSPPPSPYRPDPSRPWKRPE